MQVKTILSKNYHNDFNSSTSLVSALLLNKQILLVNLGSPKSLSKSDVREYLNEFLSDDYVLDIPKSRVGAKLVPQYRKDITPQDALDLKDAVDENQRLNRSRRMDRPSKKDRRDLEKFLDDDA